MKVPHRKIWEEIYKKNKVFVLIAIEKMRRIAYDSVMTCQVLLQYQTSQHLSNKNPEVTQIRTDEPSFARKYESDIDDSYQPTKSNSINCRLSDSVKRKPQNKKE